MIGIDEGRQNLVASRERAELVKSAQLKSANRTNYAALPLAA